MAPKPPAPSQPSEKHVIVIGDAQSGKSSLIRSICNNNQHSSDHHYHNNKLSPNTSSSSSSSIECTPFTLHTDNNQLTYTVQFMEDVETSSIVNERVLLTADLILLVIEYDLDASLEQLHSTWLPLIHHARKPFFLIQTKIDLNPQCHVLDLSHHSGSSSSDGSSGVNEYYVGGAVFSTLVPESDDLRDALVFRIFEFLFFSPCRSLSASLSFDDEVENDDEIEMEKNEETDGSNNDKNSSSGRRREIRPEFRSVVLKALRRAFWLLDKDGDGYLNPKEYLKFAVCVCSCACMNFMFETKFQSFFQLTNVNKCGGNDEYVHISEIGRYKVHAPGVF